MQANRNYDLIFDPEHWGQHGAPHDVLATLRRENPVFRYDDGRFQPVWLLTKRKDIEYVGKNPERFLSGPRTVIYRDQGFQSPLKGLPHMDRPEHTLHRRAMQGWFTPKAIRALEDRMQEIAKDIVDDMSRSNECEFVSDVGARLPLKMICELLGIPVEQEPVVWQLTQDVFSASDPDVAVSKDIQDGIHNAMAFCAEIAQSRQENPTGDFASTIANAEIDGERMGIREIASHLMIMISAGHDTTASAISGGMLALIQFPEQLDMLRDNGELTESAVNEMLRFVTPTTNFVRTASADSEIRGTRINKGDDVCLHFAAANRDEDEFDRPQEFQVDRTPNRHLTFGIGPHACIGQLLARIEMHALFRELMPRIDNIELGGTPEYVKAFWVTGLKRLPVRYQISSGASSN
jgi:cytochrome P450